VTVKGVPSRAERLTEMFKLACVVEEQRMLPFPEKDPSTSNRTVVDPLPYVVSPWSHRQAHSCMHWSGTCAQAPDLI